MPGIKDIIIDTGSMIALVAALGDLWILRSLYHQVLVPFEVCHEMRAGGSDNFSVTEFEKAVWLEKWPERLHITPMLANSLDWGEASVIQLALL